MTKKAGSPALALAEEPEHDDRYMDFDAARAAKKPLRFKMRGKLYTLPAELPVDVILEEIEAVEQDDIGSIVKMIKTILGPKNYNQMLKGTGKPDSKIDVKDLYDLTRWVAKKYGLDLPENKKEDIDNPPA